MSTTAGSFIAGGIAACGAVTVTHGFETVKTRLQLQGELASKETTTRVYRGVFHGVGVIYKYEGLRGLLRGMSAAYIYQIALNGCRLGLYEPIRGGVAYELLGDKSRQNLFVNCFAGATSGIIGACFGSPFFLVKTRLQSQSKVNPVGVQHKYTGAFNGLFSIWKTEGFRGLYRGVGPAMVRTGAGSSVQLPTYYLAKRTLEGFGMKDGPGMHLGCSTVSGFVVCCVMHPPDTIMSRMYNQDGKLYKGALDCVLKTIKSEGVMAVYKGFFAHLARILPHTILTLTLNEQTNKYMRRLEERYFLRSADQL